MTEWKECTIADIGTVVGGATPSTKDPSNYDGGEIAWITPKDLSNYEDRYISHGERNITEKGLNGCSAQLMPKHSVLFTSRAPIGYVAIADGEVCTNQGFKSVVPDENTDYLFLYYLLRYNKDMIEGLGSGTTFKEVSGSTMKGIKVRVPTTLSAQRAIGEFLDSIDCKIEENRKINKNLEQQAQAIFSKYYDASIDKQSFTSLIRVLGGGTPKTGNPEYWNGAIPFFTPKDVGEPYTFHTEKNLTEAGLDNCNSRLYPINTSFVTARGTVGKVSLAGKPMAMNQSCYALASESIDPVLVYFYVLKAVSSLKHKASGAVFDAIVTRDFDTEVINVLNSVDSKAVLEVIAPMMNTIHSNTEENIRLSSLRDVLLPRLMSGELNVSEVEI